MRAILAALAITAAHATPALAEEISCEIHTQIFEVVDHGEVIGHTAEVYYLCKPKDILPATHSALCPAKKKGTTLYIPRRAGAIEDYKDECAPGAGPH